MAQAELKPLSLVDSTHRIRWEVTKQEFDNCQFPDELESPVHTIHIDGEESEWYLQIYPKGEVDEEKNIVRLYLLRGDSIDKKYNVRYQFGIETSSGCWPFGDFVKEVYLKEEFGEGQAKHVYTFSKYGEENSELFNGWGGELCTTEEFGEHFVEDKVVVVATFVIYGEGDRYRDYMDIADDFVGDIRSASSSLVSLSDFKIISGTSTFPCYKFLLAARSDYFKVLFQNEPKKSVLNVDESPELLKAMLVFVNEGVIPENIDEEAMDLILMSDYYNLDFLTVACEKSLVNNLTPDNAVETLIAIDKINHVSKLEHRQKVLTYIKKEAAQVVKTQDWKKFVQNYPDLITEILLVK